ncbi:MAG: SsrA-binding protein SmpB [Bacillota bacterium]|nr:SsrA-binding protein SmpB [Bacillota bacterium]
MKLIAQNKKARFDYFIEDTYEAGIALYGTEVKSIRAGKASLKESYVEIRQGEAFVLGLHISPYSHGNIQNKDPDRDKKLLLHRREIMALERARAQDGYTLVPTKLYINTKGLVKIEIAIAKGKKHHDKRDTIAKRDANREVRRAIKESNR